MGGRHHPRLQFRTDLMLDDLALKGWSKFELSRRAHVSDQTVFRFFNGEFQTAKTCKKLADALGRSTRRYIITSEQQAVA